MSTLNVNKLQHVSGDQITVASNLNVTGNLIVSGTLNAKVTDFVVSADTTTLGDEASDAVTFNARDIAIPNNINFNSNTLHISASTRTVGIGVIPSNSSTASKLQINSTGSQQKWSYDAASFATIAVANDSHTTLATGESGNIILDSAGVVKLSSNTGDISLDAGDTAQLAIDMDGTSGQVDIQLKVDSDDLVFKQYDGNEVIRIADDRKLYFFDQGGEHISSDGSDLTIAAGTDINLTATTDINIPADVGLTFGNDGEKIEGDGTDLRVYGNNLILSASADVMVPTNVGVTFAGPTQKIESNDTDLTVTSGADINLTATGDVNIPSGVGVTFGHATADKIEGNGSGITVTSQALTLDVAGNITLDADGGSVIIADGTDGTIGTLLNDSTKLHLSSSQTGGGLVLSAGNNNTDIEFKGNDAGTAVTALTLDMSDAGHARMNSSLSLKEQANALADTAAYGQLWVKTATPNQLFFTTDAGDDIQITSGTALSSTGDITGVAAGVGLSGGGTSGDVTLTLDLSELSDVTPANGDKLATLDSDGSTEQLTTVAGLATLFAGTGLTATNSVIAINATQAITAVSADFAITGDLTVTGGDIVYGNGQNATLDVADVAGTNTAGKSLTILGGAGTGTGAGGDIIFQTANAGGSGSSVNSHATALTLSDDLSATFAGDITVAGGDLSLTAANDAAASILLSSDNSDDNGDDWKIIANTDQTLTIGNDIGGSNAAQLTITPNSTAADSVTTVGKLKLAGNVIQASDGGATLTLDTSDNLTLLGNFTANGSAHTFSGAVGFGTSCNPDASDGATLGTTALEWSDLYLADGANIFFGDGQEVTLTHLSGSGLVITGDANSNAGDSTGAALTLVSGAEAGTALLVFKPDEGDDAADYAHIGVQPGNHMQLSSSGVVIVDSANGSANSMGDFQIQHSGVVGFSFNADTSVATNTFMIHDDGDVGDTFYISTGVNGATTIGTSDDDDTNAHLTIMPDGDMQFKPAGGNISFTKTGVSNQGLNINVANTAASSGQVVIATQAAGQDIQIKADASAGNVIMHIDDNDERIGLGNNTSPTTTLDVEGSFTTGMVGLNATSVTVTAALHAGITNLLAKASAALSTLTLPDATGTGDVYRFIVSVVNTSNYKFVVPDGSHTMVGSVNLLDADGTAQTGYVASAADDTLILNGTTSGGQMGDWVEFVDIMANKWAVRGQLVCAAGSNIADPFSSTVS